MIAKLAGMASVHVAVAFLLMGNWALYANWDHPMPKPILAAFVQGVLSGAITYALKRTLDALRARMPHGKGWWLPSVIACTGSLCLLVSAHWMASTPEISRTISVPFSVASFYAITYNLIMWRRQ